ncbi:MAG: sulfatase-like hydrolase/transferase [Lentimicrobiaceae bacterium]|jgi:hypothetical protein
MRTLNKISFIILLGFLVSFSCKKDLKFREYLTENVIIVVMDGPRYSETWGDSTHRNIPRMSNQLSEFGIISTQFYNNGPTYTLAGHTAITTGFYQEIDNSGKELPSYPSIFQYWNAKYVNSADRSWIIASKDKLQVLNNCQFDEFNNKYEPSTDCGISGLGSGYRDDSITFNMVIKVLSENHPKLTLINFREPDYSAHSNNWDNYLKGIKSTDEYIYQIWEYIQHDFYYKGKTTLFVTNDHGRHLDSIAGGFDSHGDSCLGCRHINFYAYGPDFKHGVILNNKRELIDISATVSELMHLNMEFGKGDVMYELFE